MIECFIIKMGQLADKVRSELQHEFFKEHKKLFIVNLSEYCRQCKNYVEMNCRDRLRESKAKYRSEGVDLDSQDFL